MPPECPECPNCHKPAAGKFCADCGAPVDPETFDSRVRALLAEELAAKFKDRDTVTTEVAGDVAKRVHGWATIYVRWGGAIALLAGIALAAFGFTSFSDVKTTAAAVRSQFTELESEMQKLRAKTKSADQDIEQAAQVVSRVNQLEKDVKVTRAQVAGFYSSFIHDKFGPGEKGHYRQSPTNKNFAIVELSKEPIIDSIKVLCNDGNGTESLASFDRPQGREIQVQCIAYADERPPDERPPGYVVHLPIEVIYHPKQ